MYKKRVNAYYKIKMELVTEPDIYTPSVNVSGNYIDVIPSFTKGLRCPCGSRRGKIYETHTVFSAHTKTKAHQNWLCNLNLNKANYFVESENLTQTVKEQREIIARLDTEIQNKNMTIDYLTKQLTAHQAPSAPTVDLLSFD